MRRIPEIALGFLIASVFWAGILLWQSQKTVPDNQTQPPKTEQQHAVSGGASPQYEQHAKGSQKGKWYDTFLNHTPDWFVAIFTALLSFVTYRLVSTTGDLRGSTDKLWEAGERQIGISSQMAELTRQQVGIAGVQADIQRKQHAVGRLQYIADKRPRLAVRHVIMNPDIRGRLGNSETVVTGRLVVVNVGGTAARIVESRCRVYVSMDGLPMNLSFDGPEIP